MSKKILIIVGVILVIAIIGVAITFNKNSKEEDNTFVLGMDDSFPPMGYRNENNELVGFDIDLAQEVCNKLGMKLKFKLYLGQLKNKNLIQEILIVYGMDLDIQKKEMKQ